MKEQKYHSLPERIKEVGQNTTQIPPQRIFTAHNADNNIAEKNAAKRNTESRNVQQDGEFPLITTKQQLNKAFGTARNAFFDGDYDHLFTSLQKKILMRALIGHSHEKITRDLCLPSVDAMRKTLTKGRKTFQLNILQPRGLRKTASEDSSRARERAVREGRLPTIKFLGNYYSSEYLIQKYDKSKKNTFNMERQKNGFVRVRDLLKNQTISIQQYNRLLGEPKYAHLIEKENGNVFISQKHVAEFLSAKLPRRDLKKPSPQHVSLRSLCDSNAQYRRLLKAAKADKFSFIKKDNRYYVLPHEVSDYICSEDKGLMDGDTLLLKKEA